MSILMCANQQTKQLIRRMQRNIIGNSVERSIICLYVSMSLIVSNNMLD